jgi:DNA-binding response OmpR family regulator
VLCVTANTDQSEALNRIFAHTNWMITPVESIGRAMECLRSKKIPVVLCDATLPDGSWRELLEQIRLLEQPPEVIVFSSRADEWLWADVLEMGGYDVLECPFDVPEVYRVISLAWLRAKDIARLHQATATKTYSPTLRASG